MSTYVNPNTSGGQQAPYPILAKSTNAAVMSNSLVIANITGGDLYITDIISECITANDATASTVQYGTTPQGGSLATLSGASSSLANAVIGTTIDLNPVSLATAPVVSANGVAAIGLGNGIRVVPGTITLIVGVGSTTGTWAHYIMYQPIEPGATIQMAF
jgi:hypothetical protein